MSSAVCKDPAGIRRELQLPPTAAASHRPPTELLQDPHHQGITLSATNVDCVPVRAGWIGDHCFYFVFPYFTSWR